MNDDDDDDDDDRTKFNLVYTFSALGLDIIALQLLSSVATAYLVEYSVSGRKSDQAGS